MAARISSRSAYGPQSSRPGAPAMPWRSVRTVRLLDHFPGVRPLDLEAVVGAVDRQALGVAGRAVVLLRLDVEAAGLGVELDPARRRGAADEHHVVLFEVEEDAVADDLAVVVGRRELLGAVHREVG